MKVLIVGYACNPYEGGENSHTWNWAWHLSSLHDVSVLAYPSDRPNVEALLAERPTSSIRFHWLATPRLRKYTQRSNVALALHHLLWLRKAYLRAAELHKQFCFDLVHHVSYGSIRAAPPFWRLPIASVWGPIGGAQRAPASFRRYFGWTWGRDLMRNARIQLLRFSPSARRAAKASTVALATNWETADLLRQIGANDVRLCLDSGIPASFISGGSNPQPTGGDFTLLWVGRMERRKALPLALEALARINDVRVKLVIAGDGEMRKSWEDYAKHLHLADNAKFLGRVPWEKMPGVYQRADAFVFTSLRDSYGTQLLEAMARGLPILTLDHQGAATFVPDNAAIKIPVTSPRDVVEGISRGIRRLARNPQEVSRMGEAGRAFAKTQTWEKRAEWISEVYKEALIARTGMRLRGPVTSAAGASFEVLGIRVHAARTQDVVLRMEKWIADRDRCHTVSATSMHGIVEAQHDPSFKTILNSADLVVPDGMPLVWLGRRAGHRLPRRVYGPELMLEFCEKTAGRGYRHFFYGGEPGVPQQLAESLKRRIPSLQVCGTFSPPFRPLSPEEDQEIVTMISCAAPDVLWVGLGAPKQERWMYEHKDKLHIPVMVSVGAAFDWLSGRQKQAPRWMREHGLEWLFRLLLEPRRLWRRYLIYGAQFIAWIALDLLRLKNFSTGDEAAEDNRFTRRVGPA